MDVGHSCFCELIAAQVNCAALTVRAKRVRWVHFSEQFCFRTHALKMSRGLRAEDRLPGSQLGNAAGRGVLPLQRPALKSPAWRDFKVNPPQRFGRTPFFSEGVGRVGFEPAKAQASGFTVRKGGFAPFCVALQNRCNADECLVYGRFRFSRLCTEIHRFHR